eukprot:scaffold1468_cov206-Alexandrium_tamarense.AAC.17
MPAILKNRRQLENNGGRSIGNISSNGAGVIDTTNNKHQPHHRLSFVALSNASIATKLLLLAILSFLIGTQFKSPLAEKLSSSNAERYESGFEPPRIRQQHAQRTQPGRQGGVREDDVSGEWMESWIRRSDNNKNNNNYNNNDNTVKQQLRQPSDNKSANTKSPRVIELHYVNQKLTASPPRIINSASNNNKRNLELSIPRQGPNNPPIKPNWHTPNAADFVDGYDFNKCTPMYEWQLQSFMNCNKFHELDLLQLRMINRGGSRIAFELNQYLPEDGSVGGQTSINKFVYKTMRYGKEVDPYQIEQQRKDALVMERTSKSLFIPDIHGYCSLAVMMDFMPEGNMHDYIKGARLSDRKRRGVGGDKSLWGGGEDGFDDGGNGSVLSPVDRLKIAIHIATSVADLHTIDGTEQPSFFHNDLCCHQYLFQDGIFKLNDFNYARPIYIDKSTNERCTRSSYGMVLWKGRSLEEHQKALQHPDFTPPQPDKIDVWMMGNLMYYILTDLYTFEIPKNLDCTESGRMLVEGKRTKYPDHIAKSKHPAHKAMTKALSMCWTQEWRERPSAREVSDYMIGELKRITGEEGYPDLRVKLPERDKDQKPTDSEYNRFND